MSAPALRPEKIAGLILAGGQSRRFGGKAKAFRILAGEPLIVHALRPLRALPRVAISANRDMEAFSGFASAVIADRVQGAGPLGGVHAGLLWAQSLVPKAEWLATVPVDTPFLPDDLLASLAGVSAGVSVVVASWADDFSAVCALWRTDQLQSLAAALERGVRKMTDYLDQVPWRKADIGGGQLDPLFNINTPESLREAERLLDARRHNQGP